MHFVYCRPTRCGLRALNARSTHIMPLSEAISERAMRLIDRHAMGDGLQLGDALIAATALEHGLSLLTANLKHFRSVEGLRVEQFYPAQEGSI